MEQSTGAQNTQPHKSCCGAGGGGKWVNKVLLIVGLGVIVFLGARLFQGGGDPEFRALCQKDMGRGAWMKMEPMRDGQKLSDEQCWGCMVDNDNMVCNISEYKSLKK